jgi:hypothetical protein
MPIADSGTRRQMLAAVGHAHDIRLCAMPALGRHTGRHGRDEEQGQRSAGEQQALGRVRLQRVRLAGDLAGGSPIE